MQKSKLMGIGFSMAMILALAACDGGTEGGSSAGSSGNPSVSDEVAQQAVEKALGTAAICTVNGSPVIPGNPTDLFADSNDKAKLSLTQVVNINGEKLTVSLDWATEAEGVSFENIVPEGGGASTHQLMSFTYPESAGMTSTVDFQVTASYQDVSMVEDTYTVTLNGPEIIYDELTLAEFYEVDPADGRYYWINDEYKIQGNHGQNFYYVKMKGVVQYLAPDGNFGVIGDGEHSLMIYSGSNMDLKPSAYPALTIGNTVEVTGNLSSYYGAPQLAFITSVETVDASSCTAPVELGNINSAIYSSLEHYDGNDYRLGTLDNAVYTGNVYNSSGDKISASDIDDGKRFSFDVLLGSTTVRVSYDYHTGKGDVDIGAEIKKDLRNATAGSTAFDISGFIRWQAAENNLETTAGSYNFIPTSELA